jgi:prolyl-tRNA synthetase
MISHQLLVRGAFVRQLSAGVYSFLPLGWRVLHKIEGILREEMDAIDGQEIHMPVLNPAELWKETKRWYDIGPELVRFEDRMDREMVLAMTHEEVITDLARREVNSYRQLPFMAYQIQTKVRDEPRPRAGLVRLREFTMKDAYSFHTDWPSLDEYYPSMYQAYLNIFKRCGVAVEPVEADPGMMGGSGSHEFMMISPAGEDTLIKCHSCGYSANAEKAEARKDVGSDAAGSTVPPMTEVSTPNVKTIEDLEKFFKLPAHCFLKTVLYESAGKLVVVVIRGDLDVNEAKLARAIKALDLRLAGDEALRAAGLPAGFVSPVGLKNVTVIADDSVLEDRSYIAGANQIDKHLTNVVFNRDFKADIVTDIALAEAGHYCVHCGALLDTARGMELGHTFKLGTKYSKSMNATFLTAEGKEEPIIMGCYGIGVDRLVAAAIEQNHDDFGIVWPISIAPFQVYLAALGMDDEKVSSCANAIYSGLQRAGYEVLFDDRVESPGVKFKDADLIGIPIRITVSARSLANNSVELKRRSEKGFELVPLADINDRLKDLAAQLWREVTL